MVDAVKKVKNKYIWAQCCFFALNIEGVVASVISRH